MHDRNLTVEVLLSTWNSTRFISQQLSSIYAQEGVEVRLLVRDDGSTDGTQELLQAEQDAGRLSWYTGPNLKPARSFMHLLGQAQGADLYAFSDHDDVWLSDKLKAAATAIGKETGPALYFCQTKLVDAGLRELPQIPIRPKLTYGESLMYQFIGGCTMVMNEPLRRLVCTYEPRYLRMHDIWVYSVALSVGATVVFDPTPHILYRQHGGNSVGQSRSLGVQLRERLQRLRRDEHIRQRMAQELLRGFGHRMTAENRELTLLVAHYDKGLRNRWRALTDKRLSPASLATAITGRLAILLNKF